MAARARLTPDKPAMVLGDEVRTYEELATRSARLARVLHDLGVPSDGTGAVAAMVPNGFEFFEVAAAACRVEARFLPVNWHLKSDELAWILADSGAQVLVAHASLREFVDDALAQAPGCQVLIVGDRAMSEIRAGNDLGMHTVRLRRGEFASQHPQGREEEADYEVNTISEVRKLPFTWGISLSRAKRRNPISREKRKG